MKYHLIKNSSNRKEIGCYPQCEGVPDGYDFGMYDNPNSITNLNNDFFPDFEPEIIVQLDKKAKLTDVVSHTNFYSRGLFVNEKVKNILEHFKLPNHKFYSGTLIYNKQKLQYYWFHLVKKDLHGIDFVQSEFRTGFSPNDLDDEVLEVNSYDDFKNYKKVKPKPFNIWGSNIKLEEKYCNYNLDIIYFPFIHRDIFASENLVNKLKEEKITGLDIIEQNFL